MDSSYPNAWQVTYGDVVDREWSTHAEGNPLTRSGLFDKQLSSLTSKFEYPHVNIVVGENFAFREIGALLFNLRIWIFHM